jgi:hypothetical protein
VVVKLTRLTNKITIQLYLVAAVKFAASLQAASPGTFGYTLVLILALDFLLRRMSSMSTYWLKKTKRCSLYSRVSGSILR